MKDGTKPILPIKCSRSGVAGFPKLTLLNGLLRLRRGHAKKEGPFVEKAMAATEVLTPPLSIHHGVFLLYQVTVDNTARIVRARKKPTRR
jgi:hypothetical protein